MTVSAKPILEFKSRAAPKVLLLRPPQRFFHARFPQGPRLSVPVGPLAVASFLEQRGVDVLIYDAFVEGSAYTEIIENNFSKVRKAAQ
jgi:hypothetical protein